jgi:hypothetical protein
MLRDASLHSGPEQLKFKDAHDAYYGNKGPRDQGPNLHVTAVQGKKASDDSNANTTNWYHARGRSAFCHQQTRLPSTTVNAFECSPEDQIASSRHYAAPNISVDSSNSGQY